MPDTPFDPIKALREEIEGLASVLTTLRNFELRAESDLTRAETELNAARKLVAYARTEMLRKREVLNTLLEKSNG